MVRRRGVELAGADGVDGPNMILDDGGDATLLVHTAPSTSSAGAVPDPSTADSDELRVVLSLQRSLQVMLHADGRPDQGSDRGDDDRVHCLNQFAEQGKLLLPAINVNDSVTQIEIRQQVRVPPLWIHGINRATDVLIGRKVTVVCGYGDVGKGCAARARAIVTEIDHLRA